MAYDYDKESGEYVRVVKVLVENKSQEDGEEDAEEEEGSE